MTTGTKSDTRSIEVELSIGAPPEAVWKALTEPTELTRWFPLSASVQPGPGGVQTFSWGEQMTGGNRILEWKPGQHLRTTWFEPHAELERPPTVFNTDAEAAALLLVDYHLEGRGGGTVLRMVHSGFSRDARWDEEYESHRRGWNYELRSLRNYLEHHHGRPRHIAWVRRAIGGISAKGALARLLGAEGLAKQGTVAGLRVGERYALATVHGDRLEGTVLNNEPAREFAATVDNLDHSLVRCGIEHCFTGEPEATFWMSTWGAPERAASLQGRWTETLQALFPS